MYLSLKRTAVLAASLALCGLILTLPVAVAPGAIPSGNFLILHMFKVII